MHIKTGKWKSAAEFYDRLERQWATVRRGKLMAACSVSPSVDNQKNHTHLSLDSGQTFCVQGTSIYICAK